MALGALVPDRTPDHPPVCQITRLAPAATKLAASDKRAATLAARLAAKTAALRKCGTQSAALSKQLRCGGGPRDSVAVQFKSRFWASPTQGTQTAASQRPHPRCLMASAPLPARPGASCSVARRSRPAAAVTPRALSFAAAVNADDGGTGAPAPPSRPGSNTTTAAAATELAAALQQVAQLEAMLATGESRGGNGVPLQRQAGCPAVTGWLPVVAAALCLLQPLRLPLLASAAATAAAAAAAAAAAHCVEAVQRHGGLEEPCSWHGYTDTITVLPRASCSPRPAECNAGRAGGHLQRLGCRSRRNLRRHGNGERRLLRTCGVAAANAMCGAAAAVCQVKVAAVPGGEGAAGGEAGRSGALPGWLRGGPGKDGGGTWLTWHAPAG